MQSGANFRKLLLALTLIVTPTFAAAESAKDQIFKALDQHSEFRPFSVDVDQRHGVVTLSGYVGSDAANSFLQELAASADGVREVRNHLEVRPPIEAPRITPLTAKIGEQISTLPLSGPFKVIVGETDGTVVLSGHVASPQDKLAIESAARSVRGVSAIKDQLSVGPETSDIELSERLSRTLSQDPQVNLSGISYSVNHGVVYFSGTTKDHRFLDRILTKTLMVPGVENIKSSVEISH